jgi:hypothetical protein
MVNLNERSTMSQHLYECDRCHRYGVAHYILESDDAATRELLAPVMRLVLLCTGCWKEHKACGAH